MAGGFAADRPGYAFASGFQETLAQLQDRPRRSVTAFCATEEGGAHPRAIQTTLSPAGGRLRLQGHKTFTTLGTFADELLVVARRGERDGRPDLVVVRINADRAGVSREALPPLPIVPEIGHAELRFDAVDVGPEEVLEGDGYLRYLKPMRTVEDCHVLAAVVSWLVQVARRSRWPTSLIEDLVVILTSLRTIAALDPLAASTHVALEGVFRKSTALIAATGPQWSQVEPPTAERWRRDRGILDIAATARTRRAEAAWKHLHT
jgi:acyl-CoA dehydrogenase